MSKIVSRCPCSSFACRLELSTTPFVFLGIPMKRQHKPKRAECELIESAANLERLRAERAYWMLNEATWTPARPDNSEQSEASASAAKRTNCERNELELADCKRRELGLADASNARLLLVSRGYSGGLPAHFAERNELRSASLNQGHYFYDPNLDWSRSIASNHCPLIPKARKSSPSKTKIGENPSAPS